jgi:tRNA pseudouridine55 synthase
MDGFLVVDKPQGYTSHDIVAIVRRHFKLKRVGHTGTLDPLATGVLPLCINRATKLAGQIINSDKSYSVTMKWGVSTDTYDADGKITATRPVPIDLPEQLAQHLPNYLGSIVQTPPAYSAIKVKGKPLYWWARQGRLPPIPSREVQIYRMEVSDCTPDTTTMAVACSKGTFVRSLVNDLGEAVGCGAHVTALRRTQSGIFKIEDAISLDEIKRAAPTETALQNWILPMDVLIRQSPAP